jgi:hypothetical protein
MEFNKILTHENFMRVTHGTFLLDTYGIFLTYHTKTHGISSLVSCGSIPVVINDNICLVHQHGRLINVDWADWRLIWEVKFIFYYLISKGGRTL